MCPTDSFSGDIIPSYREIRMQLWWNQIVKWFLSFPFKIWSGSIRFLKWMKGFMIWNDYLQDSIVESSIDCELSVCHKVECVLKIMIPVTWALAIIGPASEKPEEGLDCGDIDVRIRSWHKWWRRERASVTRPDGWCEAWAGWYSQCQRKSRLDLFDFRSNKLTRQHSQTGE